MRKVTKRLKIWLEQQVLYFTTILIFIGSIPGLVIACVCEAKLEEEEPRVLLKDTGFEDQCAKLNGHPAK